LAAPVLVAGKWFVFWAVGARLFLAGLRQVLQPRFTAETILGIKGDAPLHIVQELGFANISIGALGLLSILRGAWVMPAAIAGCLFYGLAGIRHLTQRNRNALENTATVSDLFMFAVLAAYAVIALA
ncbi:MAG TPA: DUF6790 family protein, partial [Spirochaetia bacterium]|nr:DUF6790 family protein [Spirochaetia bacterium]